MSRTIRGIDFGSVCGASGVQGFFGDPNFPEYRHHLWYKKIPGFTFDGMGFTAKTTTAEPRLGNMPLQDGIRPKDFRPKCIWVNPWKGITLNAVGLSGPGIVRLLEENLWQQRLDPFRISFMPVGTSIDEKSAETALFVDTLLKYLPSFRTREIVIQLNVSCPNVGCKEADARAKVFEAHCLMTLLAKLNLPIEIKLVATIDPSVAALIAHHPCCDSVCISNTIPWGALPDKINWRKLFGLRGLGPVKPEESPLAKFGGGGLSGWPLRDLVLRWVKSFRRMYKKHINAGGGIMHPRDIPLFKSAGADSVFLGSVAMLRPSRMRKIIGTARVELTDTNRTIFVPTSHT